MIYADKSLVPPKEWEHDQNLQDNSGMTVAMTLAYNSIIPPVQWYHKPELQDK